MVIFDGSKDGPHRTEPYSGDSVPQVPTPQGEIVGFFTHGSSKSEGESLPKGPGPPKPEKPFAPHPQSTR